MLIWELAMASLEMRIEHCADTGHVTMASVVLTAIRFYLDATAPTQGESHDLCSEWMLSPSAGHEAGQ